MQTLITGSGLATAKVYPNFILTPSTLAFNPHTYTVPGGITLQETPIDDLIRPVNVSGNRAFFAFSTNAVGAHMNLSKLIVVGAIDQYNTTNPNSG
jgi:hypothetical protein